MKNTKIRNKITATLLAIAMIIGIFVTPVFAWESNEWSKEYIEKSEEMGLLPDILKNADLTRPITRAEFAAVAVKLYENLTGQTAEAAAKNPFTDTNDADVLKAYNLGIIVGVSADRFAPDSWLTREQASTILTRVYKIYSMPGWTLATDNEFELVYIMPKLFDDDAQISDWAKDSVYFMAANGIILGVSETGYIFSPKNPGLITCEQALIIAVRMVEKESFDWTELYGEDWEWDIFMAENYYRFGDEELYDDLEANVSVRKFETVLADLSKKFGIDSVYDNDDDSYYNRGQIIFNLYILIIGDVFQINFSETSISSTLDYFIANGIINERADGNYYLGDIITVEEMLVLATRTYEHIIYELELDSTGFLWKVAGENNTVYLLGSIHQTDGSVYPMSKKILEAFDSASYLAVERYFALDTEADENYHWEKACITDGTTIAAYIDSELYTAYWMICDMYEIPRSVYDYIYPWYAQELMESIYYYAIDEEAYQEYYNAWCLGIDNYFENRADYQDKEIIQLETAKSRTDMQASYSYELQEALLLWSIFDVLDVLYGEEESEEEDYLSEMLAAWKTGDEEAMIKITGRDEEYDEPVLIEYNYKLQTERDIAMTAGIVVFLTDGEVDYFVVVGSAHLVGKDSIVDMLIEAGYEVERIR